MTGCAKPSRARNAVRSMPISVAERDNIDGRELDGLKKLARHYLSYTDEQIAAAVHERDLREVICDDQ
jgi:hypothetical protein